MSDQKAKIRLIHVTTDPITLWAFFHGQIGYMKDQGFEVMAISSPGKFLEEVGAREDVEVHPLPMVRSIAPFADLKSLIGMALLLRRLKPDVVHGHTPKAALISMLAATMTRVPVRIYTVHGLMSEMRTGPVGILLKAMEFTSCLLAHRVLAVSRSVRRRLVENRLCPAEKITVPANGSANGIDVERFDPAKVAPETVANFIREHHLRPNARYVGFIGRVVKDKGINELVAAWDKVMKEVPDAHLVVIGPFERKDPIASGLEQKIRDSKNISYIEWLSDVVPAYKTFDLLVLPT